MGRMFFKRVPQGMDSSSFVHALTDRDHYLRCAARDHFFAAYLCWIDEPLYPIEADLPFLRAATHTDSISAEVGLRQTDRLLSVMADRAVPYLARRQVVRERIDAACGLVPLEQDSPGQSSCREDWGGALLDLSDATGLLLADLRQDAGSLKISTRVFLRQLTRYCAWIEPKRSLLPDSFPELGRCLPGLRSVMRKIENSERTVAGSDRRGLSRAYPALHNSLKTLLGVHRNKCQSLLEC